ncbi:alpha/beta hydrolase [Aeromicrobium sp. UC242_57]|uniref:alpha/beta hydrolase n=1 Tax=Aeromicrobium sp. UC242_57 TaxID=3374624 RepID=UPI0037A7603F
MRAEQVQSNDGEADRRMAADQQRARELLGHLVSNPEATMDDYRNLYEEVLTQFVLPEDAVSESVDAGGVPAYWVSAPGAAPSRVVVLVHGGGWTMGSAKGYRELGYRISAASDHRVLVVDYRLAPEHPYPAPHEDVLSCLPLGSPARGRPSVALVGDSAGGGLVAGAALALRDEDVEQPTCIVLFSPLLDLAGQSVSLVERAHLDPLPAAVLVENMGGAYLGGRTPQETPFASPLHADPHGLPPVLAFSGTDEGLHDDAVRFVEKVGEAGGDASYIEGDGQIHIWPLFNFLPEAATAVAQAGTFVGKHAR